jgi:hypothetical protein
VHFGILNPTLITFEVIIMENVVEDQVLAVEEGQKETAAEEHDARAKEFVKVYLDDVQLCSGLIIDKDKGLIQVRSVVEVPPYFWPGDIILASCKSGPENKAWMLKSIVSQRHEKVSIVRYASYYQLDKLMRHLLLEFAEFKSEFGIDDMPDFLAVGHHSSFDPVVLAVSLGIEQEDF